MAIRTIEIEKHVMAKNDETAQLVRERLAMNSVRAFNLVSSPGAGKTTILERTLETLGDEIEIAVVTGDVQRQYDAERLERYTDSLVQAVVTGGSCHLNARQVLESLAAIDLAKTELLFIENVGNLVCPAGYDLGEDAKIVIFSVTEGEDKPVKYPKMFRQARYAVLNKVDLLPYLDFDVNEAIAYAEEVNPELKFFFTSSKSGKGMDEWYDFIRAQVQREVTV